MLEISKYEVKNLISAEQAYDKAILNNDKAILNKSTKSYIVDTLNEIFDLIHQATNDGLFSITHYVNYAEDNFEEVHNQISMFLRNVGYEICCTENVITVSWISTEECIYDKNVINITYNGKLYKSYKELCKYYCINYRTFLSRKKRGWSLYDCINGHNYIVRKAIKLEFDNKKFSSYSDLCKYYSLPYVTFIWRKKQGWTLEECVYGKKKNIR